MISLPHHKERELEIFWQIQNKDVKVDVRDKFHLLKLCGLNITADCPKNISCSMGCHNKMVAMATVFSSDNQIMPYKLKFTVFTFWIFQAKYPLPGAI